MQERISLFSAMAIVLLASTARGADELVYTNVEQKSASIEDAIPDALDVIIERAVNDTFPQPVTTADRLARDKALSEAKRKKYDLVEYWTIDGPRKRPGSPGYVVLNATVKRSRLTDIYDTVRANIKQTPKYVVLLAISEKLVYPDGRDRQIPDGKIASAITERLVANGYDVRDAVQMSRNKKVQLDFEKLEGGDLRTIMETATDQNADIIIYGRVSAHGPRTNRTIDAKTGRRFYFWEVDSTIQAVWRDNANVLFSIPFPDGDHAGAAAGTERNGAMRALEKTGQTLAAQFLSKIRNLPPRTSIEFKIRGCEGFSQVKKIQALLKQVKEFTGVQNESMRRGTATITMATTPNPSVSDCLAQLEELEKAANVDFHVEIVEYGPNSVTAKIVPK